MNRTRCILVLNSWQVTALAALFAAVSPTRGAEPPKGLTGAVQVNGSSTIAPILTAAAEMFREVHPKVKVTVGVSGTGGGFKKFLDPEPSLRTDINNASRSIDPSEIERARSLGLEFVEIPVALDGLAVVVHPKNDFCKSLTVEELSRVWSPGSTIKNWKEIRPGFPDLALRLYGPGPDSGTFDYFTQVICGKEKASRSDYTASENDNVLVQGVQGDSGALGYFGFSYYEANKSKLRLVAIDPGDGKPVVPSLETVRSGAYHPLSRPLFIYVNKTSLARPEVRAFVDFLIANPAKIVEHPRVNYVALSDELYSVIRQRVAEGKSGSAMTAAERGKPADLLRLYRGQ